MIRHPHPPRRLIPTRPHPHGHAHIPCMDGATPFVPDRPGNVATSPHDARSRLSPHLHPATPLAADDAGRPNARRLQLVPPDVAPSSPFISLHLPCHARRRGRLWKGLAASSDSQFPLLNLRRQSRNSITVVIPAIDSGSGNEIWTTAAATAAKGGVEAIPPPRKGARGPAFHFDIPCAAVTSRPTWQRGQSRLPNGPSKPARTSQDTRSASPSDPPFFCRAGETGPGETTA